MQSPHLFCEPYDWTTPTPMKRHGKRASFQTFSRLFQLVHSFKSWEIKLKMKKEYRFLSLERYSKMSSSQENLKFGHLFSRRSFAGTEFSKERGARVELLFCLLRF